MLAILFLVLKPILNIISFPVNLVTLGMFNIFINALLIYLLPPLSGPQPLVSLFPVSNT